MKKWVQGIGISLLLLWSSVAGATTVLFAPTNISGSLWRYDYSILNDTLATSIEEFTIFFDRNIYSSLTVLESPTGWDSLAVQPDLAIPDDGFVDSLALSTPLGPGSLLEGLSVSFVWFGSGTPSAQAFQVVDPNTFATIEFGTTAPVPLPAALWLLISGLGGLSAVRRLALSPDRTR